MDVTVAEVQIAELQERTLRVTLSHGAKDVGEDAFPGGKTEHHEVGMTCVNKTNVCYLSNLA